MGNKFNLKILKLKSMNRKKQEIGSYSYINRYDSYEYKKVITKLYYYYIRSHLEYCI